MNWAEAAACRQVDPDLFFPIGTGGPDLAASRRAQSICRGCAVRQECLEWALDHRIAYGIWGGLTEQQRERLVRAAASA